MNSPRSSAAAGKWVGQGRSSKGTKLTVDNSGLRLGNADLPPAFSLACHLLLHQLCVYAIAGWPYPTSGGGQGSRQSKWRLMLGPNIPLQMSIRLIRFLP